MQKASAVVSSCQVLCHHFTVLLLCSWHVPTRTSAAKDVVYAPGEQWHCVDLARLPTAVQVVLLQQCHHIELQSPQKLARAAQQLSFKHRLFNDLDLCLHAVAPEAFNEDSNVAGAVQSSIMQHIEDFMMSQLMPLLGPSCRGTAAVEAAVSEELLDVHLANAQLGQRLTKWYVVPGHFMESQKLCTPHCISTHLNPQHDIYESLQLRIRPHTTGCMKTC